VWAELDQMPDFSNTRYANVFATPLITHVWDDGPGLNLSLRERILVHETEPGRTSTGAATSTTCMCIPRRLGREPITSMQANRAIPIGVRRFTCSIPAKAAAWHSYAPCPRAFMCIRSRA